VALDTALSLAYIALASVLAGLMAVKRVFRPTPVFFAFVCFDLVSSAAGLAMLHHAGFSESYLHFYLLYLAVNFLLYFRVLAELGKNLLRFNRVSRPYGMLAVLLFAAAAVPLCALSKWTAVPGRSPFSNGYYLAMRAGEALTFAGFLALISWSSLRKFRWPERELRIATGGVPAPSITSWTRPD
jgi:hypothetical protein